METHGIDAGVTRGDRMNGDGPCAACVRPAAMNLNLNNACYENAIPIQRGGRIMASLTINRDFIRSRSGHGFVLHLVLCALLSAAVGLGFYFFSLNWFKEHKSRRKNRRAASGRCVRDELFRATLAVRCKTAPVPATFRAHSIDEFNKRSGSKDDFSLRWVGRAGRADRNAAVGRGDGENHRDVCRRDECQAAFRRLSRSMISSSSVPSIRPTRASKVVSIATTRSQPDAHWKLNDLMGAFAIDVPIGPFLATLRAAKHRPRDRAVHRARDCRLCNFEHALPSDGRARNP